MSKVNIMNVVVLNNPCSFKQPFQFEITFDCIEYLADDLEWKITYVGSAESESYDQVLEEVLVGPVKAGRHMFVFEADAPDHTKIPSADIVGVTVVLLTCSYKRQEFIRVGYYVSNEYADPELKENPPNEVDIQQLQRNILATCPRVTRVNINWTNPGQETSGQNTEQLNGVSSDNGISLGLCRQQADDLHQLCAPLQSTEDTTLSDGEVQRAMQAAALKENTSSNIEAMEC